MKKIISLTILSIIILCGLAYSKGSPDISKFCDDVKKDGIHKKFFSPWWMRIKGRVRDVAYCQDGKIEGVLRSYWPNGDLMNETIVINGKAEGNSTSYHTNGSIRSRVFFRNGKVEGVVRSYSEEGALYSEMIYKDGKREGIAMHYYENGNIKTQFLYEKDKLLITKTYDQDSNLISEKRSALNLAYFYLKKERYHIAISILEDFIQESAEQSDYAWELLVYTCKQTREWKRLLNIAEDTINVNSHYAPVYHIAGFAASQLYGLRSKESRKYYTKYLELNPNTEETAFVKEIFPDL